MSVDQRKRLKIAELLEAGVITDHKDGNYGSFYPRIDEFGNEGVPFLTAKHVQNGQVDIANAPRLSNEKADKLPFGFIKTGDVLLSHNATVGRIGIVPQYNGRLLVGTSLTYYRVDPAKLLPRYLAAFFSSKDFQDQLASVMSQTTRNQVPVTSQRNLSIVLPPLPEQRAIAHILGTLDDKIELNRKMNETLESMARALFKSWFVDFDPVRKKMQGEPTGLPAEIDALFPGEFEDSALGEVPEGWRVGKIREDVSINYGNNMPKSKLIESGYPVYGAGGVIGFTSEPMFQEPRLLITCRGSGSGQLFETTEPAFVTNNSLILEAKNSNWRHYLREAMSIADRTPFITGSAQPQITIENLGHLLMMWPSDQLLDEFHNRIEPLWVRKYEIKQQSETLTNLRDTLLPKLISGELRVPGLSSPEGRIEGKDAERFVGGVI